MKTTALLLAGSMLLVHAACGARSDIEDSGGLSAPSAPTAAGATDILKAAAFYSSCANLEETGSSLDFLTVSPSFGFDYIECLAAHTDGCASFASCTQNNHGGIYDGCTATSPMSFCDGAKEVTCFEPDIHSYDECNAGSICTTTPPFKTIGAFGCIGSGPACSGNVVDTIDGSLGTPLGCDDADDLLRCENGFEAVSKCSAQGDGYTCRQSPGGSTFFCGIADDCTPGHEAATCDGTSIVVCNAGQNQRLDCTSLGFSGCANGFCF